MRPMGPSLPSSIPSYNLWATIIVRFAVKLSLAGRFLLELAGDERRDRIPLPLLGGDLADLELELL